MSDSQKAGAVLRHIPFCTLTTDVLALIAQTGMKGRACPAFLFFGASAPVEQCR